MKNQMKGKKGITLIALVITIIVLLILAGLTIATLTGDNGLLTKAGNAKNTSEKGEIEEQVKLAYNEWKLRKETGETVDLQNTVQTTLDKMYDNATVNKQGKAISINVKGYEFTLIDDGTMEEGKLAYLDIAEGNIDIYSNGYKQYTGNLQSLNKNGVTECTGKYILTGTTTENVVRVCDEGTYDITIKNLNIDVSNKNKVAFLAGNISTGLNVTIKIEENNKLITTSTSAISWSNVDDNEQGSTLQLCGKGKLELSCGSSNGAMCIGGNNARNITINSGNIHAIRGWECYGTVIGGSNASITINDGNIIASSIKSDALYGNSITINGGRIEAVGGEYGYAMKANEKLVINGGIIVKDAIAHDYQNTIMYGKEIEIQGGTLKADKRSRFQKTSINCNEGGSIKITGGNILARGNNNLNIVTYEGSLLVPYTPTDGTNNLYETQIKLQDVGENKKITNLTTSDNIEYGIKDMYTLEDGMLYLYLPTGTRTITITTEDGKTYSGAVQTTETPVEVTLNEIN